MKNSENRLFSRKQLYLQIELIINRNLYIDKKIMEDIYIKAENRILREIEIEKNKYI